MIDSALVRNQTCKEAAGLMCEVKLAFALRLMCPWTRRD